MNVFLVILLGSTRIPKYKTKENVAHAFVLLCNYHLRKSSITRKVEDSSNKGICVNIRYRYEVVICSDHSNSNITGGTEAT